MREPGEIRRRDDGTFEYLRSTAYSLQGGYTEVWEGVVVHAAKHMPLPRRFLDNLIEAGYRGGPHLYDLMIAEGWKAPERGYIELDPKKKLGTESELRALLPKPTEPPEPRPVIGVIIATFGDDHWYELARERAYPSATAQTDDVILAHAEHGPIEDVRNVAADRTLGDWLCFLDADDELAPGFITAMTREARAGDTKRLLTPLVQWIRDDDEQEPELPSARHTMPPLNHCVVGTLIHRDLFEQAGGFVSAYWPWSDYELWLRAARCGARVVVVPDAVYRVHVNRGSDNQTLTGPEGRKLGGRIHMEHRGAGGAWPIAGGEAYG